MIDYFRHIISLHTTLYRDGISTAQASILKGRRTLTTQHLDRYIFCLNKVIEKQFIPIIDLVKEIRTDLEASRGYSIDKKTVRRIVDHLEAEGLVHTKDIKVTYQLSYDNKDSDSETPQIKTESDPDIKQKLVPIVNAPGYEV